MGVPLTAPDAAPSLIEEVPESISMPAPEPTPVVAPAPDPVVVAAPVAAAAPAAVPVEAPVAEPTPVPPFVAPIADLGPVRLIFSDGTIAPLPVGSPEERRARYLAHRVLEATRRA
jgi:hypothetical protein